jgi:asparagine synthase (glutamine-hydrolysing)
MCGIAGRVNYDARQPVDRDILTAMTDAVRHRGPDAAGYYHGPGIGLGHRRLSIIDLATGDQPLANEDGSVQVVFNGEIYNFAEVRAELTACGHRFRTGSDTEVIVHGYEQWGERCVDRFRGMFAFAVWDANHRRLLLARDRLGVKPLYYAELPGEGLVFGSEIKSLLEDPAVPRDWRPEAIDAYLTLLYVPAPDTIYRAVRKLPPAHVLLADASGIRISRYWDLEFTGTGEAGREEEYLEELDALLREAVSLRLISDVPLGAFLSGGIDSSTVVAYMKEASGTPPVTIAVGFNHREFDEVEHAETVARHLGCEFHALEANPQVEDLLPKLAWHFDEPFADSSAVPTYYVSKAARGLVTVALSGDGGDELWAGYARHRVEQWEQRARAALGPASAVAGWLGNALPLSIKGRGRSGTWPRRPTRPTHSSTPTACSSPAPRTGSTRRTSPADRRRRRVRQLPRGVARLRLARSHGPRALHRRADLHDRRRADEGGSDEHGGLARGAGAAARPQAPRVRRARADGAQAQERSDQVSAAAGPRPPGAPVDCRARQARVRSPCRRVAPGPARGHDARAAPRRPAARSRRAGPAGGLAALGRAQDAPRGPSAPALAARDARAVVPPVHRQGAGHRGAAGGGHRFVTGVSRVCAESQGSSLLTGCTPTNGRAWCSCAT